MACFDRYACSSNNARIRRLSSVLVARRMIVLLTVVMCVAHFHVATFNSVILARTPIPFNQVSAICLPQGGFYTNVSLYWFLIVYSLCPPVLMFIFGSLTLLNISQRRRQIVPMLPEANNQRREKVSRQMMIMLIMQCALLIVCTTPVALQRIYAIVTSVQQKSMAQKSLDQLFSTFVISLAFVGHSLTFYMFTLAGSIFRGEMKKLLKKIPGCSRIIHITDTEIRVNEARLLPLELRNTMTAQKQSSNEATNPHLNQ